MVCLILTVLFWGIAEIFYKKGNVKNEKYAHLKTVIFVGISLGLLALVLLLTQDLTFNLRNLYIYLPVSALYIVSMACSYFGVRFIQESISDPIENTSGAIVPILGAIFLRGALKADNEIAWYGILGVIITVIGLIGIGVVENKGKTDLKKVFGKKLAILAFAMPFCYALLDAAGTFLDIIYLESDSSLLLDVTEDTIEQVVLICYGITFFVVGVAAYIFLAIKKVRLFSDDACITDEEAPSNALVTKRSFKEKFLAQKWKMLAAIAEMGGQIFYVYTLSPDEDSPAATLAALIDGAGVVAISFLLSRVILKEKLSKLQYAFIGVIFVGILLLSF